VQGRPVGVGASKQAAPAEAHTGAASPPRAILQQLATRSTTQASRRERSARDDATPCSSRSPQALLPHSSGNAVLDLVADGTIEGARLSGGRLLRWDAPAAGSSSCAPQPPREFYTARGDEGRGGESRARLRTERRPAWTNDRLADRHHRLRGRSRGACGAETRRARTSRCRSDPAKRSSAVWGSYFDPHDFNERDGQPARETWPPGRRGHRENARRYSATQQNLAGAARTERGASTLNRTLDVERAAARSGRGRSADSRREQGRIVLSQSRAAGRRAPSCGAMAP